jgi:hypothetical protein
VRRPDDDL